MQRRVFAGGIFAAFASVFSFATKAGASQSQPDAESISTFEMMEISDTDNWGKWKAAAYMEDRIANFALLHGLHVASIKKDAVAIEGKVYLRYEAFYSKTAIVDDRFLLAHRMGRTLSNHAECAQQSAFLVAEQ